MACLDKGLRRALTKKTVVPCQASRFSQSFVVASWPVSRVIHSRSWNMHALEGSSPEQFVLATIFFGWSLGGRLCHFVRVGFSISLVQYVGHAYSQTPTLARTYSTKTTSYSVSIGVSMSSPTEEKELSDMVARFGTGAATHFYKRAGGAITTHNMWCASVQESWRNE